MGQGHYRRQPMPSLCLLDSPAAMISAGTNHFACLLRDKSVVACGEGRGGKLGLHAETDTCVPSSVEGLKGKGVIWLRCFATHTVALTESSDGNEGGSGVREMRMRREGRGGGEGGEWRR